jgi:hypothetical protein
MTAGYERAGDGWRAVLRDGRRKVWACQCKPHPRRYSRFDGDRSAVACGCDELQRRNTTPERAQEVKR